MDTQSLSQLIDFFNDFSIGFHDFSNGYARDIDDFDLIKKKDTSEFRVLK